MLSLHVIIGSLFLLQRAALPMKRFQKQNLAKIQPINSIQTFQNISPFIDKKIELLNIYAFEPADFDFTQSEKAFKAFVQLLGSSSRLDAEVFESLLEAKNDFSRSISS